MEMNYIWMLTALILLIIGVVLMAVSRRKKPAPKPQEIFPVEAARPVVVTPPPVRVSVLSKAFQSWRSLFQEKTKDRARWEEALITSDMGPKLTGELLQKLEKSEEEPLSFFKAELLNIIRPAEAHSTPWKEQKPWVLFVVGVNGVGKTTSLVKLARFFSQNEKLKVAVVGADTFRKAAIEQLERGIKSVGCDFFSIQGSEEQVEGADPASVIFDGLSKFKQSHDVILVDTSGRLHTKKNLMEELKKMKRVAEKVLPGAPHDVWLVVDATLGQNAALQGKGFNEALGLTGLVLTKLDGLSRGGTVFQMYQELQVPIRFLGLGEKPEDLESFKSAEFVSGLFALEASGSN